MSRLADLIEEKREVFATIDAWDNGKKHAYNPFVSQPSREVKAHTYMKFRENVPRGARQ